MADQLHSLLTLHTLAAPYGGGLKPELVALLSERDRAASDGAVPLPVRQASAGPAFQRATDEELAAAGVPRIGEQRGHGRAQSAPDAVMKPRRNP
ncbi:MAG: hypothetical protein AAFY66_06955 [Pseudomonadota bacterium]